MTDTSYMVTDYPEPKGNEPEPRECTCGNPYDKSGAFFIDGLWCCAACLREEVFTNFTPVDLAEALGFRHISKEAAEYGNL